MKNNKKSIQIMVLLLFSIIILVSVVIWGFFQHIRYDEYVVKASGYTLNDEQETIQFPKDSLLYRTWNKREIIESNQSEAVDIALNGVIHLDNNAILFQKSATIIDTAGIANKIKPRSLFQENGSSYEKSNQEISEKDIVKIDNRNYFLNASAQVFVDGEKVSDVKRPQLLVDKTGSVTIYSEQKKKRYIGNLELKLSDDSVFEVSNEKYIIGKRVIDLSKFGGSDNEKYVVDAKKEKEKEKEKNDEREQDTNQSADQGTNEKKLAELERKYGQDSSNDAVKSANEKSNSAKSNGKGTSSANTETGSETDIPSIDDYDQLMRLLKKLNDASQKQIPSVNLSKIGATANSASAVFRVDDLSGTLVGPIEVQVWDAQTDKLLYTKYMTKEQSYLELKNLAPNTSYYLGYKYEYDLGDKKGLTEIKVKDQKRIFSTLNVSAIYNVSKITSSSIEALIYLDSEVNQLSKAELSIIDTQMNEIINTVDIETKGLNSSGAKVIIKNLEPEKKYQLQLEIVYDKTSKLTMNNSNIYKTTKKPELYNSKLSLTEAGLYKVAYQWNPGDYLVESAMFFIKDQQGKRYETMITDQEENLVQFTPKEKIDEKSKELSVIMEISAKDQINNKNELFVYEVDGKVKNQNKEETINFIEVEQGFSLSIKIPTEKNQNYRLEAQRKLKTKKESWSTFESQDFEGTGQLCEQTFKIETAIEKNQFDYRIAVINHENKLLQYIY